MNVDKCLDYALKVNSINILNDSCYLLAYILTHVIENLEDIVMYAIILCISQQSYQVKIFHNYLIGLSILIIPF